MCDHKWSHHAKCGHRYYVKPKLCPGAEFNGRRCDKPPDHHMPTEEFADDSNCAVCAAAVTKARKDQYAKERDDKQLALLEEGRCQQKERENKQLASDEAAERRRRAMENPTIPALLPSIPGSFDPALGLPSISQTPFMIAEPSGQTQGFQNHTGIPTQYSQEHLQARHLPIPTNMLPNALNPNLRTAAARAEQIVEIQQKAVEPLDLNPYPSEPGQQYVARITKQYNFTEEQAWDLYFGRS